MNDPFASLPLPNLKAVQVSQAEQISANDRLELAIDDLRTHLEAQFALLSIRLTACQAELAATQAALKSAQSRAGICVPEGKQLIH